MKIHMENVCKQYYQSPGFTALEDISLKFESGEWSFLVGPSGAGKTTLLKLLYKENSPDRGRVVIDGADIAKVPASRLRRSMGIIFQAHCLLQNKTAYENIAYAAEVLGTPPQQVRSRTFEILELLGLKGKADRFPNSLSGGEQQRVAVGRALVNQPKLIVADEPTGDLDPENADKVLDILDQVNREWNATVLLATHAVDLVGKLQRRVIRLEHGHVVRDTVGGYWDAPGATS
jgi:cell division transport system ATP-binding protein